MESYHCKLCPKSFQNIDEITHHLYREHRGISAETLNQATTAHAIKKQLGDYLKGDKTGVGFECCHCFELFSDLVTLQNHGRKEHNVDFDPNALKKLKEVSKLAGNKQHPRCEKCRREFFGLVISKIDGKMRQVCFNCYEGHYGPNMLQRLTIGTPDEMIQKMRKPIL